MVGDAFARAEAEERSGPPGRQVLEGFLTPHQALQQLQTFEVPEKISFTDFLFKLRIAVMNVTGVALVPPDNCKLR